jgi:hypothetical protein
MCDQLLPNPGTIPTLQKAGGSRFEGAISAALVCPLIEENRPLLLQCGNVCF